MTIFGQVTTYIYLIEFQKRGHPHTHFLIVLKQSSKIFSPEAYDKIVSIELLNPKLHSYYDKLVVKHMMHGSCGAMNLDSSCMQKKY